MSSPDQSSQGHVAPPTTVLGILRRIGPGLIIAGSIVGSGELIATTKTGAEAGFWLLWLIVVGCIIKVFVQVELGRYTVSSGSSTMVAMDQIPGPRLGHRGNWVIWYWFIMFVASIGQLGGIVGGVGQALAISAPLTAEAADYNRLAKIETKLTVDNAELAQHIERQAAGTSLNVKLPDDMNQRLLFQLLGTYEEYAKELDDRMYDRVKALEDEEETPEVLAQLSRLSEQRTALVDWQRFIIFSRETLTEISESNDRKQLVEELVQQEQFQAALQRSLLSVYQHEGITRELRKLQSDLAELTPDSPETDELQKAIAQLTEQAETLVVSAEDITAAQWNGSSTIETTFDLVRDQPAVDPPIDDKIWATIVSVLTAIILVQGRFGLIQSLSTAMVACFTLITVYNLAALQQNPSWAVSLSDIVNGMRFRLPPSDDGGTALTTALATFGIIGVGASELIAYPYWCLEKGYARFAGPREPSQEWLDRAKGWMRVMRVDAWGSMFVYTFATVAFYLLGAAVLGKSGLNPESHNLVRYLAVMYSPVFGRTTEILFLFGCFAVLYSTFFVANAGHARVFADSLRVMKLIPVTASSYSFWVKVMSGVFPMICLVIYVFFPEPAELVLLSGIMQAVMLPMLAATALFLRYRRIDPRLAPSKLWDCCLWISSLGMLVAGGWAGWSKISGMLGL